MATNTPAEAAGGDDNFDKPFMIKVANPEHAASGSKPTCAKCKKSKKAVSRGPYLLMAHILIDNSV